MITNTKVTVIPVVIGILGTVLKNLEKRHDLETCCNTKIGLNS